VNAVISVLIVTGTIGIISAALWLIAYLEERM
jgi:hypothetical protein